MRHRLAVTIFLVVPVFLAARGSAAEADLILNHGKIVTVDERFTVGQALAVRDGKILEVGTEEAVLRTRGPNTSLLDLEGRMVLPGLIDSHAHPAGAAMTEFDHEIPEMTGIRDVLDYIRARSRVVPEGAWIQVQQVFITRLREQRYPTRAELDRAAPRHPVVFRTGPDASLNSLALKRAGIGRDFKVPEGIPGKVEQDNTGEPTGILRNFANYLRIDAPESKKATEEDYLRRFQELFHDYNATGLTTVADRNASPESIDRYRVLRDRGQLTVRLALSHAIDTLGPLPAIQDAIRAVARHPLRRPDPMLRIIGIKTFLDGGMLTGSAYLREPWGVSAMYGISDPAYRGLLFIPPDRLLPIVRTAIESGLQFTAHSVGDGAVHTLLDVYEKLARDGLPVRETRSCITHCNFMSPDAVDAMARLGVVCDIQPVWLYLDTRTLQQQFGYDRLRWFQPLHSLFQAVVIAGGGSDHMQKIGSMRSINPYNPFLGIQTAVTRRARWYDGRLHPEEALTREQAIRFYTRNNAYLLFMEQLVGSLEPGKRADFIVLDRDLLTCPVEEIKETQVLQTYLDGKRIFKR
jgi:predicted amidohydrolase YtcJ